MIVNKNQNQIFNEKNNYSITRPKKNNNISIEDYAGTILPSEMRLELYRKSHDNDSIDIRTNNKSIDFENESMEKLSGIEPIKKNKIKLHTKFLRKISHIISSIANRLERKTK